MFTSWIPQYRIVFFNDRMKKDFPDLLPGDLCYQTLFKEASPCSRCPLKSVDTSEFLIYQPSLKNWLNITWEKSNGQAQVIATSWYPTRQALKTALLSQLNVLLLQTVLRLALTRICPLRRDLSSPLYMCSLR